MSLFDAARDARRHADTCTNPSCHAVANALEGALATERAKRYEPADTTRIPDPSSAGFVSEVRISKPGTEN
jgi:hypothetical protein